MKIQIVDIGWTDDFFTHYYNLVIGLFGKWEDDYNIDSSGWYSGYFIPDKELVIHLQHSRRDYIIPKLYLKQVKIREM